MNYTAIQLMTIIHLFVAGEATSLVEVHGAQGPQGLSVQVYRGGGRLSWW